MGCLRFESVSIEELKRIFEQISDVSDSVGLLDSKSRIDPKCLVQVNDHASVQNSNVRTTKNQLIWMAASGYVVSQSQRTTRIRLLLGRNELEDFLFCRK